MPKVPQTASGRARGRARPLTTFATAPGPMTCQSLDWFQMLCRTGGRLWQPEARPDLGRLILRREEDASWWDSLARGTDGWSLRMRLMEREAAGFLLFFFF